MGNLDGFDANEVEPRSDFEPLPNGRYGVVIVESSFKKTSKGDGSYLSLTMEVIDEGPYKGRKLWENLNLDNPNPTAVQIAKGQLSSICRAVGVLTPKDSSELHDKPMVVRTAVELRSDTGEPKNVVKGYYPFSDEKPQAKAFAASAAQPTKAATTKAPWKR